MALSNVLLCNTCIIDTLIYRDGTAIRFENKAAKYEALERM